MSAVSTIVRSFAAIVLPSPLLRRAGALRGTRFLISRLLNALVSGARPPFTLVNVGACDGALFDDVTPWVKRIRSARALLIEPIPYNQKRLRNNFPDEDRFVIESVAITRQAGPIAIKTFNVAALESGTLPIEFIGCSSLTQTNLMSGKDAWGSADPNFAQFEPHLTFIDVQGEPLQTVLDRNEITYIDALVIDCEGADWTVFDQFDFARYRPGMVKIEIGSLPEVEIGKVIVKLKSNGYSIGLNAEDVWAFAERA